jgi:hypothetical protein
MATTLSTFNMHVHKQHVPVESTQKGIHSFSHPSKFRKTSRTKRENKFISKEKASERERERSEGKSIMTEWTESGEVGAGWRKITIIMHL